LGLNQEEYITFIGSGFRVQGFKVQGFRVQRFRVALPQYHQIDLFSRSKKYLTAENAENAEVILIFLSQRSPTGA
jgi:hypothetical protein